MIDLNPDLIKKMKFKEGNRLIVINKEKVHKLSFIGGIITTNKISEADKILLFADSISSLRSSFLKILKSIGKETILWIAYPKKSSRIKTDLEPVSKLLVLRKHKNINVKWTNIIQRSPMHFGKK
ncbi:hypothetical protein LEP1GSC055_3948 [Leptospira borgpetersenii str. Brem 307]|nr:hypothetical protein LEP1GSC055_3948 [Leptospira borgpetersenii str. Brem 307]